MPQHTYDLRVVSGQVTRTIDQVVSYLTYLSYFTSNAISFTDIRDEPVNQRFNFCFLTSKRDIETLKSISVGFPLVLTTDVTCSMLESISTDLSGFPSRFWPLYRTRFLMLLNHGDYISIICFFLTQVFF